MTLQKFFPPYYKYVAFVLAGFQFAFSCIVLATGEAFYKSAALILPISYQIFDDTVQKEADDFDWTSVEKFQLEQYKFQMLLLWAISGFGIFICMLIILPQFFDFNDRKGNPTHFCLVFRHLSWFMFWVLVTYIVVLGSVLIWAWLACPSATDLFFDHFNKAEKEEIFLTQLEKALECTTDDDKEIDAHELCWQNIQQGFIRKSYLDFLVIAYFVGTATSFLLIPFVNKPLFKSDEDGSDRLL